MLTLKMTKDILLQLVGTKQKEPGKGKVTPFSLARAQRGRSKSEIRTKAVVLKLPKEVEWMDSQKTFTDDIIYYEEALATIEAKTSSPEGLKPATALSKKIDEVV